MTEKDDNPDWSGYGYANIKTASEIFGETRFEMPAEMRETRIREFKHYIKGYNDMRAWVLAHAAHPGMIVDFENKTMEMLPYPKNVQELLDKVTKMEGEFVKHNFPEFYKAENYVRSL